MSASLRGTRFSGARPRGATGRAREPHSLGPDGQTCVSRTGGSLPGRGCVRTVTGTWVFPPWALVVANSARRQVALWREASLNVAAPS